MDTNGGSATFGSAVGNRGSFGNGGIVSFGRGGRVGRDGNVGFGRVGSGGRGGNVAGTGKLQFIDKTPAGAGGVGGAGGGVSNRWRAALLMFMLNDIKAKNRITAHCLQEAIENKSDYFKCALMVRVLEMKIPQTTFCIYIVGFWGIMQQVVDIAYAVARFKEKMRKLGYQFTIPIFSLPKNFSYYCGLVVVVSCQLSNKPHGYWIGW